MKNKILIALGGILLLVLVFIGINFKKSDDSKPFKEASNSLEPIGPGDKIKDAVQNLPNCPANLDGSLTSPLIDLSKVSAIVPLGNLNPPGHTSPVDHNYFTVAENGKVALYAPADSLITQIITISQKNSPSDNYLPLGYVIQYTVCKGLVLDFANYNGVSDKILKGIENEKLECQGDITKPGHDKIEQQCYYRVAIPVRAGEEIGYAQNDERGVMGFEIWAADYNKPARADVNWDYYNDNRYAHSICTFDLYSGNLKKEFYSKLGHFDYPSNDKIVRPRNFTPRTVEPLCGEVNQDIVGTIQGMWFGEPPIKSGYIEFEGKGLAFVHNNFDPTIASLSVGGNITKNAGVIEFKPTHSGTIDREFSEVKADGNIYCYNSPGGWLSDKGKILIKLLDNTNLQAEFQTGSCNGKEKFNNPFAYER